jgi:hypothetical protein
MTVHLISHIRMIKEEKYKIQIISIPLLDCLDSILEEAH